MGRRFIVEADGGSRGNPGPSAYGAVVRDRDSGALLAESGASVGITTNNVAEYSGLVAGLTAAFAIDPTATVEVRMDSKLVVEQMSGRWAIKNAALRDIALAAKKIFPPQQVTYKWIPRAENSAADAIVNKVLDGAWTQPAPVIEVVEPQGLFDLSESSSAEEPAAPQRPALVGWAPDMGAPTTLLLVRHGATQFSLDKKFSGSGGEDVPLAPIGELQVRAAAQELLARGGADVIVASPLLRTRQSAAIIADVLGLEVTIAPGFAECEFGEWDGHTFSEVAKIWPTELDAWLASTDVAPPGGESLSECRHRVNTARRRLIEAHRGKRVVVVSHVTPIKSCVGAALDAPHRSFFRMELMPASISTVLWWADGNCSLTGFADSAHLRGIDAPANI